MRESSLPTEPFKLSQGATEEVTYKSSAATFSIHSPRSHSVISHSPDGTIVGTFDFNQKPCTFTGDVDESAKIFVDAICRIFNNQV